MELISSQHKDTAQWAMQFALNNGCQDARVSIITGQNSSFEYRNTQLDKLQQSSENKLYIELFINGRYGSFSTNRIEKSELESFIKNGIDSVKFLASDTARRLPDAERYYKDNGKDLDLYDPSYASLIVEDKLNVAVQSVAEILGSNDKIVSILSSYDDGCSAEYMIASNGFEGLIQDSAFSLTVEVALKTNGDARPESYWYDSSVYFSDLQKTGIARTALERALRKLGQQKVRSGKYVLLLDNTMSTRLITPLFSAMYGASLQQKNSFLIDKLNKQVFSAGLTLYDRPHIARTFGARWFDGEGVATSDRTIIENGVLNTYFIDTYNSLKMDMEPTIASPSIVVAKLGEKNFMEMIASTTNGIWVTGFNGGNTNPTTGDFSFGIEGFLIKNGVVSQPVSEMNITGNMLTLWQNLLEVGNDPRNNTSWRIPALSFSDVNFSGL